MAFVRLVDTDENEHYVNLDAIVNVRTTMSGGTFVDVNGLEAPIFMRKHAKDVVEMLMTGEVFQRGAGSAGLGPSPGCGPERRCRRIAGAGGGRDPRARRRPDPGTGNLHRRELIRSG